MSFISAYVFAEVIDRIRVVVNDEVITQREIDRRATLIYEQYKLLYKDEELKEKMQEVYDKIIDQLINDKLVVSKAKQNGIQVTDKEIEEEMKKVKSNFNREEEFYLTLERQGISLNELKENYKSTLIAKKLIDKEIGSKVTVIPGEVYDYYVNNKDEFRLPPMVRVRSILIRIKEDRGSEDALMLAKEIYGQLKGDGDFSEMARKYSDDQYAPSGGDMGYIKKGEMRKKIDDVIFSLKEGEISDIQRSDLGFHIFKVEEIRAQEQKTFDESKNQIERFLFNRKIQEKLTTYVEQLRENAYIDYK